MSGSVENYALIAKPSVSRAFVVNAWHERVNLRGRCCWRRWRRRGRRLPLYSHRHSPKKFTQHQLFACLVLKCFLKTDYRGVVAHLADCPSLVEAIELAQYPALHDAAKSSPATAVQPLRRDDLLDATVREQLGRKRRVPRSAIDSTGLEATAASGYFVRRRDRVGTPWKTVVYHRFPKLGVVCDVETHFILAAQEGRGPKPDVADFRPLVLAALARVRLDRIVADAGYDSEPNHAFARRQCGMRSIIPAKHGRPTTKPARGHYRRLMQTRFDDAAYRDRVQVETVISMVKRRLEPCVRRPHRLDPTPRTPLESPHPQRHDSLTHRGFLQSQNVPFSDPVHHWGSCLRLRKSHRSHPDISHHLHT